MGFVNFHEQAKTGERIFNLGGVMADAGVFLFSELGCMILEPSGQHGFVDDCVCVSFCSGEACAGEGVAETVVTS